MLASPVERAGKTAASSLLSVSAIIPTRNRPDALEAAVQSLLLQSVLPRQVIIVDQSPGTESRRRIDQLVEHDGTGAAQELKLSYLHDPAIRGVNMARNRSMELAEGEIWLFLDDDVVLEPDFLRELLAVYAEWPDVVGVSGTITNYSPPPRAFRFWSAVFMRGPFHDDRQPVYWRASKVCDGDPVGVTKMGGGLMSFRAGAIRRLRWDERLPEQGYGEDIDFCAALGPQARLMIAPRARLVHNLNPVGRIKGHWLRRHARSQWYLYCKNWRHGLKNRACFYWLNVGYALVATSAFLRGSLAAWRFLLTGIREGTRAARP